MADNAFDEERKLVVLGAAGVGKTALALAFVKGSFNDNTQPTIGGKTIRLHIWDTAGQERFSSIAPMYYRGADGALIVFDLTSEESFQRAKGWITELEENVARPTARVLVGNKADLDGRKVSRAQAEEYAQEKGMAYLESSAKDGINVEAVFMEVAAKAALQEASAPSGGQPKPNKERGCC